MGKHISIMLMLAKLLFIHAKMLKIVVYSALVVTFLGVILKYSCGIDYCCNILHRPDIVQNFAAILY